MSPERFVKGESERTAKIHIDLAALTHRRSVDDDQKRARELRARASLTGFRV